MEHPVQLVPARRQRGASLAIALIALLALTFAGLALVRAVDTANLIAGNFSFRQAVLSTADMGMEAAIGSLGTLVATAAQDANAPAGCTDGGKNCGYYAFIPSAYRFNFDAANCPPTGSDLCDYANGISSRIDWTSTNLASGNANYGTVDFAGLGSSYSYQYVIERLCQGTVGSTVITTATIGASCFSMSAHAGGSVKSDAALLGQYADIYEVAYRITVRVQGPHNASTVTQSIVMKTNALSS